MIVKSQKSNLRLFIAIYVCIYTSDFAIAQKRFIEETASEHLQTFFSFSTNARRPTILPAVQFDNLEERQNNFECQIIIQSGDPIEDSKPVTSLGTGPSINNYGKIAFTALKESDDARTVCLYDQGKFLRKFYTAANLPGSAVQVNDLDHIAYWARYYIDPDLNTYVLRLDTDNSGPVIASGNPWIYRWETEFNSLTAFVSIGNNDRVIFGGDLRTGGTVLASRPNGSDPFQMSDTISGSSIFFPMIADDNRAIVRGGVSESAPVVLFLDESLNLENAIGLATSTEFIRIGDKPGISDDGRISVFMAEHNTEGAGIYVTTVNYKGEAVQFLLYSLPGDQVNLNQRVAVNRSGSNSQFEYLVTFLAKDEQGILTLLAVTIDVSDPYSPIHKSTASIIKVGETISGLEGRIENLNIYDPVNNSGEIVFWVRTESNNQAIIKAHSTPIAFIDDFPDYTKDANDDTDNYFLRQEEDYKNIKIYYRIQDGLPVIDVKINIYPEMEEAPLLSLPGEKLDEQTFKTGDNLQIIWENVKVKDGDQYKFREYGFYRLELEVLLEGATTPIKTSIEDADPDMPGWQCPQDGVGIHDLVYKHRPVIYTGSNEVVTPNGPIHPFSEEIIPLYRLREAKENLDGDLESVNASDYTEFGDFSKIVPFDYHKILSIQTSDPNSTLFIDIKRESLARNTFSESHLFHRGHPNTLTNHIFIHFWMYHPTSHSSYGLPLNRFWHEGDWEMVQLCLQKKDHQMQNCKASWFLPFAATASQHYYGQTLAWDITKNGLESDLINQRYVETFENGKRINIYIAENSHACYFREGTIKVPPSTDAGCGIQHQYEDHLVVVKDIISSPLKNVEYELQPLEIKQGIDIFDWRGLWGEYQSWHVGFIGYAPPGPLFRMSKRNRGGGFNMNRLPHQFHDLCRKLVDKNGNFSLDGNRDLLTKLAGYPSAKRSTEFSLPLTGEQISLSDKELLWAQQAEESVAVLGTSLATDKENNVIVAGTNIYDSKINGMDLSGSENAHSFLAKYDSTGILRWIKELSGTDDVFGLEIATDGEGSTFVSGRFMDTLQMGVHILISEGFTDVFLIKIDKEGNLIWAKQGNGTGDSLTGGIALNDKGEIIFIGSYYDNIRFGDIILESQGGEDIFIAKYDNQGDLIWAIREGGSGDDYGLGIDYSETGNIGITGYFEGHASFSGSELISEGKSDMFLARYTGNGELEWVTHGGGLGDDYGSDLSIDSDGNINLTGVFVDTAIFNDTNIISNGGEDIFLAQYNSGGTLNWIDTYGGLQNESGFKIETNQNNELLIAGNFSDTITMGDTVLTPLSSGTDYSIIGQFDQQGVYQGVHQLSGLGHILINDLSTDNKDNLLVTGMFNRTMNIGDISMNSSGYYADIFTAKIIARNEIVPSNGGIKLFPNTTHILSDVYPNPFVQNAQLSLTVFKSQPVQVSIYNESGQLVSHIYDGIIHAGNKQIFELDGKTWPSGHYMCIIKGDHFRESRKIVLIK